MKNDLNKFFEFKLKRADYQNPNLINSYAVFQINDEEGYIEIPGKILKQQEEKFLVKLMDDGIDENASFIEWIPFEYIRGIQEFKVFDRSNLLNKFKKDNAYIITNLNDDKLQIKFINGDSLTIDFSCRNNTNQECCTSYPIFLIKEIEEINNS